MAGCAEEDAAEAGVTERGRGDLKRGLRIGEAEKEMGEEEVEGEAGRSEDSDGDEEGVAGDFDSVIRVSQARMETMGKTKSRRLTV